jgi:hypothetical protein
MKLQIFTYRLVARLISSVIALSFAYAANCSAQFSSGATIGASFPRVSNEVGRELPQSAGKSQDRIPCGLGEDQTAVICFDSEPLTVDHCANLIIPHFKVYRKDNNARYYFSYRLYRDGKATPFNEGSPNDGKYKLSAPDYQVETSPQLVIEYPGKGRYSIEVTVHVENLADPIVSKVDWPLSDAPIVAGVIVGVSHYDIGQDFPPAPDDSSTRDSINTEDEKESSALVNLLHADQDAKDFYELLHQAYPDSKLRLLTSDNPEALPTKTGIEDAINDIIEHSGVCQEREDDWFIFYFSGHGILVDDSRTIEHYLGSMNFMPDKPRKTGLRESALFNKIADDVPAPNKLIVLDSCFSGSSITSIENKKKAKSSQNPLQSPSVKMKFVKGNQFVPPYAVSSSDADTNDLIRFKDQESDAGQHALAIAAAALNQTAQEGLVTKVAGSVKFKPSEQETTEERAKGHGLFTYLFLRHLINNMSVNFMPIQLKDLDASPSQQTDTCAIDFTRATNGTEDDLRGLWLTNHDFQLAEHQESKKVMNPMNCVLLRKSGTDDASSNH